MKGQHNERSNNRPAGTMLNPHRMGGSICHPCSTTKLNNTMTTKKLNKKELKEEISSILNIIMQDMANHSNTITENEVYSDSDDEFIPLTKSARIVAIQAMTDCDFLVRRLCKLSAEI